MQNFRDARIYGANGCKLSALLLVAFVTLMQVCSGAVTADVVPSLLPKPPIIKPERVVVDPERHDPNVIIVKFHDDLLIRLRNEQLTDLGRDLLGKADVKAVLDELGTSRWRRLGPDVSEQRLDEMRHIAQQNLGRVVADMNTYFHVYLEPGADAAQMIDALNSLDIVELAQPLPIPVTPLPPDFQQFQGYLNETPTGVDAYHGWDVLGTLGEGVRIIDIEYLFNANHLDLPPVTILGVTPGSPSGNSNHGTAVLGQLGAVHNGWGTSGIAPESDLHFGATWSNGDWVWDNSILLAASAFDPGDVILIELAIAGPNFPGGGTQFGTVPMEWLLPTYDAIVTAVGNGMIVIVPAGNGHQNLDDPVYFQGNFGHWPFLPQNDSGSIIIGAGHAPGAFGGSGVDRSRLEFSNWGSRVNVQGWGEAVMTTGYGTTYNDEGPNLWYTGWFGGTSSASPIVAGAAALLQSAYKDLHGVAIEPSVLREALIQTGSPQQAGTFPVSQHIGPRPDIKEAMAALVVIPCPADLTEDGSVGVPDLLELLGVWGPCDGCAADFNGDNSVGVPDLLELLSAWGSCTE